VWDRYNPEDFYFQNFLASEVSREKYWQMATEMYESMKDAKPNAAHLAIAELELLGKLELRDHAEYRRPAPQGGKL